MISVGAADVAEWSIASPVVEDYSSWYPTRNAPQHRKPDITGPDNVGTIGEGMFRGTSAAAPHVTGAAALLLQTGRALTRRAIMGFLRRRATDVGPQVGRDNMSGGFAAAWCSDPDLAARTHPDTYSNANGNSHAKCYGYTHNHPNPESDGNLRARRVFGHGGDIDDGRGRDLASAAGEMDGAGNAVIVWQDHRSGTDEIYWTKVDRFGTKLTADQSLTSGTFPASYRITVSTTLGRSTWPSRRVVVSVSRAPPRMAPGSGTAPRSSCVRPV